MSANPNIGFGSCCCCSEVDWVPNGNVVFEGKELVALLMLLVLMLLGTAKIEAEPVVLAGAEPNEKLPCDVDAGITGAGTGTLSSFDATSGGLLGAPNAPRPVESGVDVLNRGAGLSLVFSLLPPKEKFKVDG